MNHRTISRGMLILLIGMLVSTTRVGQAAAFRPPKSAVPPFSAQTMPDLVVPDSGPGRYAAMAAASGSPLAVADGVWFFYQGTANTVALTGDWNGWDPHAQPLERISDSDLWAAHLPLPPDGMFNYRFVVDGIARTDPWNPLRTDALGQEFSVFVGPTAPGAADEPEPGSAPGSTESIWLDSQLLDRRVLLRVHVPPACSLRTPCAAVYALDGNYYLEEGHLPSVTAALAVRRLAPPSVVVAIDPHPNPLLRILEMLPGLAVEFSIGEFLATEVIPAVENRFPVQPERNARVLLGMSASGAAALRAGAEYPALFRGVVAQSPVVFPDLHTQLLNFRDRVPRLSIAWGRLESDLLGLDIAGAAAELALDLADAGWPLRYREWPAGHTMVFWRRDLTPALGWVWSDLPPPAPDGDWPEDSS